LSATTLRTRRPRSDKNNLVCNLNRDPLVLKTTIFPRCVMKKFFVLLLVAFCLYPARSLACTTFCLKNKGEVLFGKNYDWMIGDGLIFVNKRNVSKEGTADKNAAKWISKYGSVTFNQYGRENPSGGMNEMGLVIELMWLDDTQYPKMDNKPTVDVLEWIQYQLDTAATTAEVIRNSADLRIDADAKLHYLVNDKNGNPATIEFLNGKLIPHTADDLPVAALTNNTYESSLEFAKKTETAKAQGAGSLERFARAAEKTKDFDKKQKNEKEAVDYAFSILGDVAQPNYTQWSIVYDQKRGRIYFRTLRSPQIKSVDARAFDYDCAGAVKLFDVNSRGTGDVTAFFKDYSRAANRDLIERSFNGTDFLKNVPASVKDSLASYPEGFACAVK
jgi:penicillin V acylase-like amidase (Ntn superfamily)